MERISNHISWQEGIITTTGLPNVPNDKQLENMQVVASVCFEPLRLWYGKPIKINSFFRSPEVNKAVGGAKTSQHLNGEAIDITGGSREENKKIFDWCKANLVFDQLINEYDYKWIHISFRRGNNRNQTLNIT